MATRPTTRERLAAWTALICVGLLVVLVIVVLLAKPLSLLLAVVGLAMVGGGGWWMVTEQAPRRIFGIIVLGLGVVAIVVAVLSRVQQSEWRIVVVLGVIALVGLAAGQARMAVATGLHEQAQGCEKPRYPVLIANRKSGGGKVDKFGLADLAREQGVEVIFLEPGDDLEQLARDAVARGCDCLGMAGGDGSQALVASVAVEHDLPFVCVSAGTRNHFAMDLGLNREDPREGIIAFSQGLERRIDFATVGDRLFVNNVSMGVYATIVQEESYRDAKMETSKELLPELLGARNEPFDLEFTTPDGTDVDGAFVILVSNNPYVLGPKIDVSQRRSLTTGKLGVFAINARTGKEAASLLARTTLGLGGRDPHIHQFEVPEFEVRSRSGSAFAGVDGEALDLATPLEFRIHPEGLRIRVPAQSQDRLRRREARNISVSQLLRVAAGHPMAAHTAHATADSGT